MKKALVARSTLALTSLAMIMTLVLAGCGREAAVPPQNQQNKQDQQDQQDQQSRLSIRVSTGNDSETAGWTLTCQPPGGSHPAPEAACAALEDASEPFAPVPPGQICTQIYGGPQTATIEGVWRGEEVHATYSRTDGCEIHRWDALKPVLQPGEATEGTG